MPATLAAYRLSQAFRAAMVTLRASVVRGLLAQGWSEEAIVALVATGQRQAATRADRFLADYLTIELGEGRTVVGVDPDDYTRTDKTVRAIRTAAALHTGPRLTVVRRQIVENEILWSARTAQRDAMTATPEVDGWRRLTDADPCPMCRGLADGSVLPPEVDMVAHPSCACVAVPSVSGRDDRYVPPTFTEASRDG